MVWFNGEKDLGVVRIEGGEQTEVAGDAFAVGQKPVGRCGGRVVEFSVLNGTLTEIAFVAEVEARRARLRRRR
jgi:hypothetical protein